MTTDSAPDGGEDVPDDSPNLDRSVDRAFTCTVCGFATSREAGLLQWEVGAVCPNCGDWTVQLADDRALIEAARTAAEALAGATLTERQALAYLLRDVLGMDREPSARALDSTSSNVDNLRRRATEKLDDAERVLDELETLRSDAENATGA